VSVVELIEADLVFMSISNEIIIQYYTHRVHNGTLHRLTVEDKTIIRKIKEETVGGSESK